MRAKFFIVKRYLEFMIIRKARKEDINAINFLDRESTRYHENFDKDFHTVSEKFWTMKKDSQIKAIKSSKELILVAEIDRKVIGYIWGYIEEVIKYKIGKIQELIVTFKERGKGIGTRLITEMLNFFKKNKCIISEIEVFVDNLPALKTYEKIGFRKREYKMQLKLDNRKFSPFV